MRRALRDVEKISHDAVNIEADDQLPIQKAIDRPAKEAIKNPNRSNTESKSVTAKLIPKKPYQPKSVVREEKPKTDSKANVFSDELSYPKNNSEEGIAVVVEAVSAINFPTQVAPNFEKEGFKTVTEYSETAVDSAIREILAPATFEVKDKQPSASELVLNIIVENFEISQETAEKTEAFLEAIPEDVQTSLLEFMQTAEPEEVETVELLVVQIAEASDRLHELAMDGQLESEEAIQIKALIVEWYQDVLAKLEIEFDDEMIAAFIEKICAETYAKKLTEDDDKIDIFRELERSVYTGRILRAVSDLRHAMPKEIAKLMVSQSTSSKLVA